MFYRDDTDNDRINLSDIQRSIESKVYEREFKKQLEIEKSFWISEKDIDSVILFLQNIKSDNDLFMRDINNAIAFLKQALSKT